MSYNWDVSSQLSDIEIEQIKLSVINIKDKLISYKNNVVENLYDVLELDEELSILLSKLYVIHSHISDVDLSDAKASGNMLAISSFYHDIVNQLSFVIPEILESETEKLIQIANKKEFKKYNKMLLDLIKSKKYILSQKEEKILSMASEATSTSYDIYSTLTNSDMKFKDITDSKGQSYKMDESKWSVYSQSYDRVLRKNAFISLLEGYKNLKQTISTIYLSYLKTQKFNTNVRGYQSPRQKALFNNDIDVEIYDNLVSAVNESVHINHDYIKLRKEMLGVDNLHLYDMYVPIIKDINTVFEYDNAKDLVINSLSILGEDYLNNIIISLTNNSIDVYPKENKRSGAYSGGSYDTKPYILLNYTNTLNDVFTLTHELGHSMHSLYSNKHQEYVNSNYKIFVAEIASTVNELLLYNYLLEKEKDDDMRRYLLSYNLDQYRTTVFRQTMFAEFEYKSSKMFFDGDDINEEILSELYLDLNKTYFGKDIEVDELIKYEWLRIPHFYYDFYVYQYATSFCVSQLIVDKILSGDQVMIENYLEFLKKGDSQDPITLIKELGIDITKKETIINALNIYKQTINKLREIKE